MNGIDPRFVTIFGVWTSILLMIAGFGPSFFEGALPPAIGAMIVRWCAIFGAINSVMLTGGSAFSSAKPGPMINASPPSITPTIVKILLFAFVLSFFLPNGSAMAQTHKLKTPDQIGQDIRNALERPLTTASNEIVSAVSKPLKDLADFLTTGLDEAAALAIAVPDLQDGNGQACWLAMAATGRILKEHPVPLTLKVAADLESLRLLNMAANRICQNAACTQVFTEAGNLISAAAPMPLALPNLTSLCSKVPEIAIVAPQAVLPVVSTPAVVFAPAAAAEPVTPPK